MGPAEAGGGALFSICCMAVAQPMNEQDGDMPDLVDSAPWVDRLAVYDLGRGKWVCHDSYLKVTAALPDADGSDAYEIVFLENDAIIINTLAEKQLEPAKILQTDLVVMEILPTLLRLVLLSPFLMDLHGSSVVLMKMQMLVTLM